MMNKCPESVLIVDDEAHIRAYLKLLLAKLGLDQFSEAGNGEEALEIFEADHPDLVLLDVNMPRMDGYAALKGILGLDSEAVVVMMTSVDTREMVEKCLEAGAFNYIIKDSSREEMQGSLEETIRSMREG